MTATTASRFGSIEDGADKLALFLKVFANETLATFEETNVMKGVLQSRTIASGKSAQFPVSGRASAFFHQVGNNIADAGSGLSTILHDERLIFVDNKLTSAVVIADIDEAMNHYDVRSLYSSELGRALAKRFDQLGIHVTILAARAAATITGLNGGSVVSDANMATQGVALSKALFDSAQKLDEKDVPKEDRYAVISPAMYYNLIRDPTTTQVTLTTVSTSIASSGFPLLNREISPGNGNYAKGLIYEVAGFKLLVSNHIPSTNITSGDAFFGTGVGGAGANGNVYHGDFTKTKGLAFHKSAVGLLKLRDLAVESERKIELQGQLTIAKMVIGMGILRPESAIELAIP